ncbi:MAG: hypothetical protein CVV49_12985 [Spirochaetae bacterium HGW-Spirochaetae-5]|nr:MAG: hypothetical protein CVV49_12985 [Spirochaetae bacterium HGW-Spirochaetae-5]
MKQLICVYVFFAFLLSSCYNGMSDVYDTLTDINKGIRITYMSNGATDGAVPNDNYPYKAGQDIVVSDNTGFLLNIDGATTAYKFMCWNTESDGSGIDYFPGSTIDDVDSDVTLYAKWTPYAVKDIGPAGGWIFYDKGSYSSGWRYMEAAPDTTETFNKYWSITNPLSDNANLGTTLSIGDGLSNTDLIINGLTGQTGVAGYLCYNLSIENNGKTYSDWFLPSYNEITEIYLNLHRASPPVGNFLDADYWSSSEVTNQTAYKKRFTAAGTQVAGNKNENGRVRAVRYF